MVKAEPRPLKNVSVLALAILVPLAGVARGQATSSILPGPKPADAPKEWKAWIGDYRDGVKEQPHHAGDAEDLKGDNASGSTKREKGSGRSRKSESMNSLWKAMARAHSSDS